MGKARIAVGAVVLAVLGAGVGTIDPAGAATAPAAVPYFAASETPLDVSGSRLTVAGSRLFVTDFAQDRVLVLDEQGNAISTITNQGGPATAVVSPDGSKVYLALEKANAISVLDVASASEVARIPVGPCPSSLAWSSDRLFYSYGCDYKNPGVASVDPAAPAAPVPALTGFQWPPRLAGTGNTLLVTGGTSVPTVSSFTTAAGGSAAPVAVSPVSVGVTATSDLVVTPNGDRVLVGAESPDAVFALSLPDLSPLGSYPTPNQSRSMSTSIAVSPDGSRLLVGATDGGSSIRLFDTSSHNLIWQRYAGAEGRNYFSDGWLYANRLVFLGGTAFSPDGSTVYALTQESNGRNPALFRSPVLPSATGVSMELNAPYGKPATAQATVGGGGTGVVQFWLRHDYEVQSLGSAPIVNGVATRQINPREVGELEAVYTGDRSHFPSASVRLPFKPATGLAIKMGGSGKSIRGGVTTYGSYSDIRVKIQLQPKTGGKPVYVTLWKWRKGKWRDQGYQQLKTDGTGAVKIQFRQHVGGKLCFTAWHPGDAKHAESGVSGPSFSMRK